MNLQDAIDVIESAPGFNDETTSVGEAWAAVLASIYCAPAPVQVAERPWEREGWCDELGRCWLLLYPDDGFHLPNWKLDRPSHHELPNGAVSLPAHALPLPVGEVEP